MDIPASRLIVYEHDGSQLKEIDSFYASIGVAGFAKRRDGDQKTPVGVYRIMKFIPGERLHERYGPGALPINYPNELDQIYERTGDGIWLHGTESDFVNRAPRASDGCLSLANGDFLALYNLVRNNPATAVVIDSKPEWVDQTELHTRRKLLSHTINRWLQAMFTSDTAALSHYYSFTNRDGSIQHEGQDRPSLSFSRYAATLRLKDVQFFLYPGEERLYVADLWLTHGQNPSFGIRQYWHHTGDNQWRIIGEFSILSSLSGTTNNP
jgi:hypothetical protein